MSTLANTPRFQTITLASATAGPFDITLRLFSDDMRVTVNDVATEAYTLTTNYVDGFTDDATIEFDAALEIGDVVVISPTLPAARPVNYSDTEPGLTRKLNIELVRIWSVLQQFTRDFTRGLKLPANAAQSTDVAAPTDAFQVLSSNSDNTAIVWIDTADAGVVFDPTLFLAKSGNLAGLADTAEALENLDLIATAAELNVLEGIDVTTEELNYLADATGNIQTQLNGRIVTGPAPVSLLDDFDDLTTGGIYNTFGTWANSPPFGSTNNRQTIVLDKVQDTAFDAITQITSTIGGTQPNLHARTGSGDPLVWTAWQQLQTSSTALGVGQTWQDVGGSRVSDGTAYQNTTGRPICVVWSRDTAGGFSDFDVSADGVTYIEVTRMGSADNAHVVIPNGYYYRVTGGGQRSWIELR